MSLVMKIASFLLLALCLHQASGLRCWVCTSRMSPECGDPMNITDHHRQFHTKNCDETLSQHPYSYDRPVCRKTVQRVDGERIVIRACAIPSPEEREVTEGVCSPEASASYITTESCNVCSTDLCNGAYSALGQAYGLTTLLLFSLPSFFFAYRWTF